MMILDKVFSIFPEPMRYTLFLRSFGFLKIPLIYFIRPSVTCLNDERCTIKLAFKRRVKNHLNSIYFGALAIAAECTGGVAVMKEIKESGHKISLIFKDFHAEFLKRAEADTYFTCSDIHAIQSFVDEVIESGERKELPFHVVATCPSQFGEEPVAKFTVTVSLKKIA